MTIDNYKTAKLIREQIQHFKIKQTQIRQMKERIDDEDFNNLRRLAFDGCEFAINTLEKKFEKL